MDKIEKIRQEIERRKKICEDIFERESDTYYQGKAVAYGELLPFIDSLPDEHLRDSTKMISEDERIRKELKEAFEVYDIESSWNLIPVKRILAWLEKQKELFESGRGLYYYDGEKTTYCGYPATEENPYDFAMSQQEKQKEQKPIIQDVELNDAVYDYVRDHFIAGADFTPEYIKKLMENAFFAGVDYYLLKQESESCEPGTNVEKVIEDVIRVYGKTQGEWVGGYDVDTLIVNLRRAFNKKEQKPVQSEVEREYVRTLKSLISDFLRGKEDVDREYYQQIFDWLDGRHIEQKPVDFPTTDEEVNEFLETHSKVEVPEKYKTPDFVFSKQEYKSYPIISKDTTSVKPAEWSEEDEEISKRIIADLRWGRRNTVSDKDIRQYDEEINWMENRLKSLRPVSKESLQPHWKPSENQMSMLLAVVNDPNNAGSASCHLSLKSLYNDLKKL